MTTRSQSSTNPQQLLGDAIVALRATQPENAVLLARQAVELGLVDGLASSSQVARDLLGTDELVNYTVRKDPFVEFMEQFGTSFGKGVASFFSTQVMTMR